MKIETIRLTNFRGFEELELQLDPRLTVLIARNGKGKSSILDAISTNLAAFLTRLPGVSGSSFKESDFRVNLDGNKPPYMRIYTRTTKGIEWDRTEKRDQTKRTTSQIPDGIGLKQLNAYVDQFIDAHNEGKHYQLPVLIHYGTGRGVFEIPQRKQAFGKSFPRLKSLTGALASQTNFKRFVEYFYFLEDEENRLQKEKRSFDIEIPELKAIRSAINRVLPQFKNPRTIAPAGLMFDWQQENEIKQLRIEQLSDGFRTTLAMIMDTAARMAEANPDMDDPLATEGTVLIDEVDLHLHPEWQRNFLPTLIDAFPNIQFVVTTHSPFIVQSVDKGKIIDLDDLINQARYQPGQPLSIEDITESVMGVENVQRSEKYNLRMRLAQEYYQLLNKGHDANSEIVKQVETRLDEIETFFGDNPAESALLKSERRAR